MTAPRTLPPGIAPISGDEARRLIHHTSGPELDALLARADAVRRAASSSANARDRSRRFRDREADECRKALEERGNERLKVGLRLRIVRSHETTVTWPAPTRNRRVPVTAGKSEGAPWLRNQALPKTQAFFV